ncbi:MAG: pitrilysin family protein [candidate division Zixibacteria bacterium]|nr:pitrilysin family protein [candidate division Zixibacteria bacterium]
MAIRTAAIGGGLFQKTTLSDGLRIVTEEIPSVRSISIGVWVEVGSRNETREENGISHFIEHMLFKGTKRRTAKQIAYSLESIGGGLNAFTSREQTCYTARVLDEYLDEAIDVLADITCCSTYTKINLDRERLVICEEIKESIDNPSDQIHDLFAKTYWGDHPLGAPILGPKENIMSFNRATMLEYVQRHYRSGSIVVAASGSISHRRLVKLVRDKFSFPMGVAAAPVAAKRSLEKNISITSSTNNQTHFCLGFPGVSYGSKDRMTALALNAYLGGGMSSVLFQKVREEKGLAYSVYTFHDFQRDTGIFGAYLGTDVDHLQQASDIVLAECRRMKRTKLTAEKLDPVKAQIKGQLTLSLESTSNRMNRIARLELLLGRFQPLSETLKEIDRVTPSQVLELANRLFDDSKMAVAVLGPADKQALAHVA